MADEQESLEVKGPGGLMAKATGANVIATLTAIAMCVVVVLVWDHRVESKEAMRAYSLEHEKTLDKVIAALEKNAEAQDVTNYIFSLTPEERARLRLDMPEALRRRIR